MLIGTDLRYFLDLIELHRLRAACFVHSAAVLTVFDRLMTDLSGGETRAVKMRRMCCGSLLCRGQTCCCLVIVAVAVRFDLVVW
eukprot:COSAG02_NODE_4966_length_4774_cov_7.241925_3_plen_84_part_00